MTIRELKEQLQEDVLSILDAWGIEEEMGEKDFRKMSDEICDAIIHNINMLNEKTSV